MSQSLMLRVCLLSNGSHDGESGTESLENADTAAMSAKKMERNGMWQKTCRIRYALGCESQPRLFSSQQSRPMQMNDKGLLFQTMKPLELGERGKGKEGGVHTQHLITTQACRGELYGRY